MRRRLSKSAIFQFALNFTAASFLASIIVVLFYHWWVFDLFSHFRVQYVLLGFIILPVLLWLKNYWVAGIVAAAVIFHAFAIWPYLQGSTVVASESLPPSDTLMFANVYYVNSDLNKIADVVHKEKPELVVFAELNKMNYEKLKTMLQQEYPYSDFEEGEDAYDLSYFAKNKPTSVEVPEFSENDPSFVIKYTLSKKPINIIGMHPHSPLAPEATASRDKHINAALEYASQLPGATLVMGDFNLTQFSPKFPQLLKKYNFIDTQRQFGLQPSWHADRPTFFRIPIDQVLVNNKVTVYDRHLGGSTGSDHLPVIVKVAVQ